MVGNSRFPVNTGRYLPGATLRSIISNRSAATNASTSDPIQLTASSPIRSATQPPSQPPSATAQTCPPNTELLGGNCVPYTARCKNGMALDAMPQACAMEEKQVCRPRGDGLKDCCCLTYSKF